LYFLKQPIFSPKFVKKSQKIVIITSTPGKWTEQTKSDRPVMSDSVVRINLLIQFFFFSRAEGCHPFQIILGA
jgi:hypothetical protein